MMSPEFAYIGINSGDHSEFGKMAVLSYTGPVLLTEKTPEPVKDKNGNIDVHCQKGTPGFHSSTQQQSYKASDAGILEKLTSVYTEENKVDAVEDKPIQI